MDGIHIVAFAEEEDPGNVKHGHVNWNSITQNNK